MIDYWIYLCNVQCIHYMSWISKSIITRTRPTNFFVFTFSSIWIIHWKCLVLPNKTSPFIIQKPQEGKSALLRHPVSYNIEKYFLQNFIILFFLKRGACRVALFCFIWEGVRKRERIREMRELSNRSSLTKTSPLKSRDITRRNKYSGRKYRVKQLKRDSFSLFLYHFH